MTRRALTRTGSAVLALVALAAMVVALHGPVTSQDRGERAAPTATVARGDVLDQIAALGSLQPRRYVDVGAQVSGQLQRLHVAIGDQVSAGDLLAEIDARTTQANVRTGEAELQRLRALLTQHEANRDLLTLQVQRQQRMFAANATSRDALETVQAQLREREALIAQTHAQIAAQESRLTADRAILSFTRIVAPMDGTVVSLTATEGQMLNANMNAPILMRIADLSSMTVTAQVSEADQPRLSPGMPIRFSTLGSPERVYQATLRQIYPTPEIVNNVVLYQALFDIPNRDGALLPQMTAQVFFVRAHARGVLTVPASALDPPRRGADPSVRRVRVLGPDGAIEPREVTIGVTDRVSAEVRAGLAEGERVVLNERAAPGPQQQTQRPPRVPMR